jgi:ketosteroid isomerase-like protein
MADRNVETVRRTYELFNQWGAHPGGEHNPGIPPLLHAEVEFHAYSGAPEAGVYRGREAVLDYHQRVFEQFESVRNEVEELLPAGDHVVVVSRQHTVPKGSEAEIVQQMVEVWTVRDGLLAERKSFPSRAEALAAAGLPE